MGIMGYWSTSIVLFLDLSPFIMVMADLRTCLCSAMAFTTALLAFPSAAGALTYTLRSPSSSMMRGLRALGNTLTFKIMNENMYKINTFAPILGFNQLGA